MEQNELSAEQVKIYDAETIANTHKEDWPYQFSTVPKYVSLSDHQKLVTSLKKQVDELLKCRKANEDLFAKNSELKSQVETMREALELAELEIKTIYKKMNYSTSNVLIQVQEALKKGGNDNG